MEKVVYYIVAGLEIIILILISLAYWSTLALQRRYQQMTNNAEKEFEAKRKRLLEEARLEAQRLRGEIEQEIKDRRSDLQRQERRLQQREESLDRRLEFLERKERDLINREREIQRQREEVHRLLQEQRKRMETLAQMTTEEARNMLLRQMDEELEFEYAKRIRQTEENIRLEAEKRAKKIIALAIQRCAVDQVSELTVCTIPLPNDEMKGRIIGREGRNIRTFENLTGVDVIIDDTPECVVLSSFDPVRREVARIALTNLVNDGRIHPGRIEEEVEHAREEIERQIREAGEQAIFETGVTGLHPELVRTLGKLKFRTSYGQNVLEHSIEVCRLMALLAAELGADVNIAKRAGLLHDLGKAIDYEIEAPHHDISVDLCRRYGESPEVIHAIEAHHGDVEPQTIEAVLLQAADAISSARPGARKEVLENYIKRLRQLEEIGDSIPGVEKTYVVQAGREVRIMVKPEEVDDTKAVLLAREVARRIEEEVPHPGQIKVTVIREVRAVEFAK